MKRSIEDGLSSAGAGRSAAAAILNDSVEHIDLTATIRELEGMDRGRYAGPVGWFDSRGDGEFGIALRCAEVRPGSLRLFAGCGIVTGSDPEAELAESRAKFTPIRDALS